MKKHRMNKNGNGELAAMVGVVCLILAIVFALVGFVGTMTIVEKDYNTDVHCHIVNARYSQDPAVVKSELILAKQGMIDAGLTNDTYGTFWGFTHTPDNSMRQQYVQLDQAIGMCDMLLTMDKDTASYGAALTNLQNYIYDDNGWADEVAESAYGYNNAPFLYWQCYAIAGVFAIMIIVCWIYVAVVD